MMTRKRKHSKSHLKKVDAEARRICKQMYHKWPSEAAFEKCVYTRMVEMFEKAAIRRLKRQGRA